MEASHAYTNYVADLTLSCKSVSGMGQPGIVIVQVMLHCTVATTDMHS